MSQTGIEKDRTKLSAEIGRLESLELDQLRTRWKALHGTESPRRFSRDLLIRAVAYRMQERVLGRLKPAVDRLLARLAQDVQARRPTRVVPSRRLAPGTVLLREWNGIKHKVTVLETGCMFGGKRYHSLSAVARQITGARWSGPLFFGLKDTRKEATGGTR